MADQVRMTMTFSWEAMIGRSNAAELIGQEMIVAIGSTSATLTVTNARKLSTGRLLVELAGDVHETRSVLAT